ncbi:MAG: hypothetical protein HQK55_19190, partial [Deltaproteobacteria bacterium]|nr:hypothetical protein [Deltaproteobacteria bacterium]
IVPWTKIEDYLNANQGSGPITSSAAVMAGRAIGLNAVVLGSISELSQVTKRAGWRRWFRFFTKQRDYVNAMLVAKALDVESGIILWANVGTGEAMVSQTADDVWMGTKSNVLEQSTVVSTMEQAVEELSEGLLVGFGKANWKGFITKVTGDTATLNAGKDVGIRPGHRFDVLTVKDKITNAAGQTYIVPGPPKAQLEVVQANDETSELKILSGEVITGETAQFVN